MDIYLLNEIQKLEADSGSSAAASGDMFLRKVEGNTALHNENIVPLITRVSNRYASDGYSYSSSFAGTTYSTYQTSAHHARVKFWLPSGAARKDNNNVTTESEGTPTQVLYGHGNKVGGAMSKGGYWQGNNYAPHRHSIMFIKNKGTSSKSVSIYNQYSNFWSSGHDGSSALVAIPNSSDKSSVTDVSYTQLWSRSSGNGYQYTNSGSFNLAAGRTAAVMMANSMYYHQDSASWASWHDQHWYYNLNTTFGDSDVVPDYEMTQTYLMMRHYVSSYTIEPRSVWNACEIYYPPAAT